MINRPPLRARRAVDAVQGLAVGIATSLVLLIGTFVVQAHAADALTRARIAMLRAPKTLTPQDLLARRNALASAIGLLDDAIVARNSAIDSVSRLDRLAQALPIGARLVEYNAQTGQVQAEAEESPLLGRLVAAWSNEGYITSPSTQLGSPGSAKTAPIEPNISMTISTPTPPPTPQPTATPATFMQPIQSVMQGKTP